MSIKLTNKTKAVATLQLSNAIRTYLFEQECGELKPSTPTQIKKLQDALKVLNQITSKH